MPLIHIIYASTSGHTEYVVEQVQKYLQKNAPAISLSIQRAESATSEDLLKGDVLILGSGTWNTGGPEGQLNMHMDRLLKSVDPAMDLKGKPMTFISLGDERYYFRTRCTEHLLRFMREHHGTLLTPPIVLVNEPYGQEEKIEKWAWGLVERMGK